MNIESYFLNTLYAFVAVFVAMDVAGGLPIYIALTEGFEGPQKRRVIRQSIITSLAVMMIRRGLIDFITEVKP